MATLLYTSQTKSIEQHHEVLWHRFLTLQYFITQGIRIINLHHKFILILTKLAYYFHAGSHKSHRWRVVLPALVGFAESSQPDGKHER